MHGFTYVRPSEWVDATHRTPNTVKVPSIWLMTNAVPSAVHARRSGASRARQNALCFSAAG